MPKDLRIIFIVHSYLHFLCSCFLKVFFFWHSVLLNTTNIKIDLRSAVDKLGIF